MGKNVQAAQEPCAPDLCHSLDHPEAEVKEKDFAQSIEAWKLFHGNHQFLLSPNPAGLRGNSLEFEENGCNTALGHGKDKLTDPGVHLAVPQFKLHVIT
ncbi:hypothetical protein WISP_114491 [Willisornis vidua]|uniref:Uncharacterized protein n=1 Tax=Willisornis vidua TaxID=1566151 RepID=A0ABQ9D0A9_9PASS|nr:hypothetical protein WISP_114491 [Willisornis vidua]